MADITFIEQNAPVDEYGRALYAVARSIVRAMIDSLTAEDLTDLNTPLADVTMRQLSKVARLERDKGMRRDGFEWAVHEANCASICSMTGSRWTSLIVRTLATTCHCVTQSTALMWYTPWCRPGRPGARCRCG